MTSPSEPSKQFSDPNSKNPAMTHEATKLGPRTIGNYEVGYGRPPKRTQFQKGRSGNPKGRPKGKSPEDRIREVICKVMLEPVTVRVNGGESREMPLIEAAFRQTLHKATQKGDARALKTAFDIYKEEGRINLQANAEDQQYGVLVVPEPARDPQEWEDRYGSKLADYQQKARREWEAKHPNNAAKS